MALTRLQVIEAFQNGRPGEIVEMIGGLGGADCSFHFQAGDAYLVIAHLYEGFWSTSGCSRSQRVEGHNEELEALRAVRDGKPVARSIVGSLHDATDRGLRNSYRPLADWPLTLKGPADAQEITTGQSGSFAFRNLQPGSYQLDSNRPGWTMSSRKIELSAGCHEVFGGLKEVQSSVRGRVRPAPGQTLGRVPITLVPVTPPPGYWRSGSVSMDAYGNFTIKEVEPGEYLAAINPGGIPVPSREDFQRRVQPGLPFAASFYPGVDSRERAEVIRVERGSDVELPADWVVPPPLTERSVPVVITWPDGTPAPGTRAVVKDQPRDANVAFCGPADSNGKLDCKMFVGRRYRVEAFTVQPKAGLYYWAAIDLPPDTTGPVVVRVSEDGPNPRYMLIGGEQPAEIRRMQGPAKGPATP